MDGEADGNLANLNPAKEPMEQTGLSTKLIELQEKSRRVDVAVSLLVVNVLASFLGLILAVVATYTSLNKALRRTAEVFELQFKGNCLAGQLSRVTSECDTGRSFGARAV